MSWESCLGSHVMSKELKPSSGWQSRCLLSTPVLLCFINADAIGIGYPGVTTRSAIEAMSHNCENTIKRPAIGLQWVSFCSLRGYEKPHE